MSPKKMLKIKLEMEKLKRIKSSGKKEKKSLILELTQSLHNKKAKTTSLVKTKKMIRNLKGKKAR